MNERNAPLQAVIPFLLEQTLRMSRAHAQRAFVEAGIDITVEQWVLLMQVSQRPLIAQHELAATALKDAASITRMVDALQKHGLVARHAAPDDRRKYLLQLTPAGEALIEQHLDLVVRLRAQGVQGFSPEEVLQLRDFLLRMQANFE